MTWSERFLKALKHQKTDHLPMCDFLFQQQLYEAMIGVYPEEYNGVDAVNCALALDHDGVWIPYGGFSGMQPKFLDKNVYIDEWGTTYKKNESSWPIDAPGGGYILVSDHSLHYGIPVENIKIMFETGRECGDKYCHANSGTR